MDLIMNSSTCGLNSFKASSWDEIVHFVDFVLILPTCGLDNELVHLWT